MERMERMDRKRKRNNEDLSAISSLSSYVLSPSSSLKRLPGRSSIASSSSPDSSASSSSSASSVSFVSSPFSTNEANETNSSCSCSVVNYGFMQKLAGLVSPSKVSEWKNNLPEAPRYDNNIVARYHSNNNRLWVGQRSPGRKLPNILKLTYQEKNSVNKRWILENMCILYECNDDIWVLNIIELGRQIASTPGLIMNPINGTLFFSDEIIRFKAEYEKNVFRIENPQLIKQLPYQCMDIACSVTGFSKAYPTEISNLKISANILALILKGLRHVNPESFLITIAYLTIKTINTLTHHSDIAERLLRGDYRKTDIPILIKTFESKLYEDMLKPSKGNPIYKFVIGQAINNYNKLSVEIFKSVLEKKKKNDGYQCKMSDEQYKLYIEYQNDVDLKIPLYS